MRKIHIAVGQEGRRRKSGEHLFVLLADCRFNDLLTAVAQRRPQTARPFACLVKTLLGPQLDHSSDRHRAEQITHDPPAVIAVVHVEDEVAQADEGVRVPSRRGKRVGTPMDVTDHMYPHAR